jgi:adenylate cyclase
MATFRLGAALVERGEVEEAIAKMREGLAAWRAAGAQLEVPYRLSVLAEAHGKLGQADVALALLTEALTLADETGEGFWRAEMYRLKGTLPFAQSREHQHEAEACVRRAIEIARAQGAKSLELRAVMSLSRWWARQGKRDDARRLLAEIYGWFTEGFDTADLREARALLEELSPP